jgi:heme/copper-type cytochrome/quinol oxidase subunit 4
MTPSPTQPQKKTAAFRRGVVTFVILAVLTVVELWVSTATTGSPVFLFIIALAKAGLILWYFMHIFSLWSEEAHG